MAKITRTQTGESSVYFEFQDGELKSAEDMTTDLSVSIDFPAEDDEEDSSFKLSLGNESILTLQFKLYSESVDRTGTGIETFEEIIPYLKRTLFKKTVGEVLYRIQMTTKFETIDAYYELQDFNITTDSSIYPSGSIKFKLRYYN